MGILSDVSVKSDRGSAFWRDDPAGDGFDRNGLRCQLKKIHGSCRVSAARDGGEDGELVIFFQYFAAICVFLIHGKKQFVRPECRIFSNSEVENLPALGVVRHLNFSRVSPRCIRRGTKEQYRHLHSSIER